MENDMPYNVITGILPECLQLDTISEILSSKLRKLPTGNSALVPQRRSICSFDDGKPMEKVIWHMGRKKRFLKRGIGLKKRITCIFLLNLS